MELTDLASELRQKIISFALSTHDLTSSPRICPCLSQTPLSPCSCIEVRWPLQRQRLPVTKNNLFSCPPIFLTNHLLSSDAAQVVHKSPSQSNLRVCSAICASKTLRSCSEQTLDRITTVTLERPILHAEPIHIRRFSLGTTFERGFYVDLHNSYCEVFRALQGFFITDGNYFPDMPDITNDTEVRGDVQWFVKSWAVKKPEGKRYTSEEKLRMYMGDIPRLG